MIPIGTPDRRPSHDMAEISTRLTVVTQRIPRMIRGLTR